MKLKVVLPDEKFLNAAQQLIGIAQKKYMDLDLQGRDHNKTARSKATPVLRHSLRKGP